jgi:dimethylargininase
MVKFNLKNIRITNMVMKFKNAIVRKPCPEMINGITKANLGKPDFNKASEQHNRYVDILKQCGLKVEVLEADNRFPDSTFIEDVMLCTPQCAVITNPGALTRREEVTEMKQILTDYYKIIEEIKSPGTLDAGDVMMVGNHFYIGISERTNHSGAEQIITILKKYNMTGSKILLSNVLHLKTGISYLEMNNLLVSGEFTDNPEFANFNRILVDKNEEYAANSLWINGIVLVPVGFPETKKKIESAGYKTIETDVSEFQKLDGGLSCLSVRF